MTKAENIALTPREVDKAETIFETDSFNCAEKAYLLANAFDQPLSIESEPIWTSKEVFGSPEIIVGLEFLGEQERRQDKACLGRIRFYDAAANKIDYKDRDSARSANVGIYKYLPFGKKHHTVVRFFPPPGTKKFSIGLQRWQGEARIALAPRISFVRLAAGVSVLVPVYKGVAFVGRLLQSLAAQSLDRTLFEIVFVLNGPDDGTAEILAAFQKSNRTLNIRVETIDQANVSAARNKAVELASRQYTTFVDVDDTVSEHYLAALYARAEPNAVVFATLYDVSDADQLEKDTAINRCLSRHSGAAPVRLDQLNPVSTINACKLIPTTLMKLEKFDENLKSSEDTAFFASLFSRHRLNCLVTENLEQAHYRRRVVFNSVSRKELSYDFNVVQRLQVIRLLNDILEEATINENKLFLKAKIRAQIQFMSRYIAAHPDARMQVIEAIRNEHLAYCPIDFLNSDCAETLVVSYCFVPSVDTSAIVMAKRIGRMSVPVDVIYNPMREQRKLDEQLNFLTEQNLGRRFVLDTPSSFSHWASIQAFADKALSTVRERSDQKGAYKSLYSRSMWPGSHFAAALIKAVFPQTAWTAEFSDPLLYDIKGQRRNGQLQRSWLASTPILDFIETAGWPVPTDDNLFFWCEYLPYCIADSIIFTNALQRDYMLRTIESPELLRRVSERSVVSAQPTPKAEMYRLVSTDYALSPDVLNIAYFGAMYATRDIDDVVSALKLLDPAQREKIRFHIFTESANFKTKLHRLGPLRSVFICNSYVPFFQFLNLTTKFDMLFINDALTKPYKTVNPYLPSKLSDYRGSGSEVWAHVEDGSSMSVSPDIGFRSRLGDVTSVIDVLTAALDKLILQRART